MDRTQRLISNRRKAITKVLEELGIHERGALAAYDKLSGVYGLGPALSKQLAHDLETLTPDQWCVVYPRIAATRQVVVTSEHYDADLEQLFGVG